MAVPDIWEDLEMEFADQDTADVTAQILIGVDKATLFPTDVTNPDGTIAETSMCRLMKSRITNRVILFGACEDHNHADYPDLEEDDGRADRIEGSCNQVQIDKDADQVSALATLMDALAITSIDDISLVDKE